jgi:O-antigen/teichoic acid export membrane protein
MHSSIIDILKSRVIPIVSINFIKQIFQIFIIIYIARQISPSIFGLIALINTIMFLCSIIIDGGKTDNIMRGHKKVPDNINAYHYHAIVYGLIISILFIASYYFIYSHNEIINTIVLISAINILISSLNTIPSAILYKKNDIKSISIRNGLSIFLGVITVLIMSNRGYPELAIPAQLLVQQLTLSIYAIFYQIKVFALPSFLIYPFAYGTKEILTSKLLDFAARKSDDLIIGFFLGAEALGIYSLCYQFLVALEGVLMQGLDYISAAAFSDKSSKEEQKKYFLQLGSASALLSFPCFIGLILISPEWFPVVFGQTWSDCIPIMQILAIVGLLNTLLYTCGSYLKSQGQYGFYLRYTALYSSTLIVAYLLSYPFGLLAIVLAYLLISLPFYYYLWNHIARILTITRTEYLHIIQQPFFYSMAMAIPIIGIYSTMPSGNLRLFLIIISGILCYSILNIKNIRHLIKPESNRD